MESKNMGMLRFFVIGTLALYVCEGQDSRPIVYEVLEDSPAFTFVGNIAIGSHLTQKYNDSTVLNSMQFKFLSQPDLGDEYFTIEETTGIIRTGKPIDRDKLCPAMVDCHIKMEVAIVKPIEYFQVIEVQVNILDINDNAPKFPHEEFAVKFSEASSIGTSVSLPIALDLDSPQHGVKQYRMLSRSNEFDLRAASDTSGMGDLRLVLKRPLDREQIDFYQVIVAAIDGGSSAKTGTMLVDITVEDSNDHRPKFEDFPYEVDVLENQATNISFFTVTAVDDDTGMNGKIFYAFSPRTQTLRGDLFAIDRNSGSLYLKKSLDYEKDTEYQLEISANDGGPDSLSAQTTVTVKVVDVNDYKPHITINTLTDSDIPQIPEGSKVGSFVAHISVLDLDNGENGRVTCSLKPTRNSDTFHLNEFRKNQFKLVTASELDREMMDLFILNVECKDHGSPVLTGSKNLTVLVKDINDHTPQFGSALYTGSLVENNSPDAYIVLVNASDADAGPNSLLTYEILERAVSPYVYIQEKTGIVRAFQTLDHEEVEKLEFTVLVQDHGSPPRSNKAAVSITILDVNDEAPVFSADRYSFRVQENSRNETFVGQVQATDRDSPPYNQFKFSLIENQAPGYFSINSDTGEIKTRQSLDREKHPVFFLIVVATDLNDPGSLSSTVTVTVAVQDENDNVPHIEYPSKENNSVKISNLVPLGFKVLRIRAEDKDSGANGQLTYKIMGRQPDSPFVINYTTGMITTRKDLQSIKYEGFPLTVLVKDNGDPVKAATMDIVIIVDESFPFSVDSGGAIRGTNLTIIIVVAAVSGFIMLILIIAIAAMKFYDRRKAPQHVYKCRVEEQKIMAKAKLAEREREKKGKNSKKNSKKQNVSFSMDECGGSKHQEATQNDLNQSYGEVSRYTGDPTISPDHTAVAFDSYHSHGRQDRQLESHLLNLLKEDHDAESASSTEMSNTDSGRGPSEEGEHSKQGNHMMDGGPPRANSRSSVHRPGVGTPRSQPDGGRSTPVTANRLSWQNAPQGAPRGYGPPPPPSAASIRANPHIRAAVLNRTPVGYGGDHPDVHRQYPMDNGRSHHSRQSPTPMRTFMPDNGRLDGNTDNSYHSTRKYGVHLPGPHRQRSLGDGAPKSNSQDFKECKQEDPNTLCNEIDKRFFKGVIV